MKELQEKILKAVSYTHLSKDLFSQIDKDKLKNDPIKVEIYENGVFVNIDKSLEDIDIDDKYEVREVLDNILIKGYCDHDVIQFMEFLGKVPIYEEEILIVEILCLLYTSKNPTWNYENGAATKAWVNAQGFKNYLVYSGRGYYLAKGSYEEVYKEAYKLRPGDIVGYEKNGRITHVSTCLLYTSRCV